MPVRRTTLRVAAFLGAIVGVGCAQRAHTVDGECQDVFGAEVCTWGTVSGEDVVEFGATVPLTSIDGAPADAEMVFPPLLIAAVRLPEQVREATGFDHLGINWEAHGHPPEHYLAPHFDFHFYRMSPTEIAAIDCTNLAKPEVLPTGYALPDMEIPGLGTLVGVCVPAMGMHAVLEAELKKTELFGASMLVGYYDQSPMFLEPMIARTKLQEHQSFTLGVPSLPDGANVGPWPTAFEAAYDDAAKAYRLVFKTVGE